MVFSHFSTNNNLNGPLYSLSVTGKTVPMRVLKGRQQIYCVWRETFLYKELNNCFTRTTRTSGTSEDRLFITAMIHNLVLTGVFFAVLNNDSA